MNTSEGSFKFVRKERALNSLTTTSQNKVPACKDVTTKSLGLGNKGDVLYDDATDTFYGFNGVELLSLGPSSVQLETGNFSPVASAAPGSRFDSYSNSAAFYQRVGDVVTVSGQVDITKIAASGYVGFYLTLPVSPGVFTATSNAVGYSNFFSVPSISQSTVSISAFVGDDKVLVGLTNDIGAVTTETIRYSFQYQIQP